MARGKIMTVIMGGCGVFLYKIVDNYLYCDNLEYRFV